MFLSSSWLWAPVWAQGFYVAAVPLHGGRIHNRLDRSFIHQRALT
ncbi:MAG: hypothetical protein WCR23_11125 [Planctomycetota bacterium]